MKRPPWWSGVPVAILLGSVGCGGAIAGPEFQLRVELAGDSVQSGRAFSVRIVRVWREDHAADPLSPRLLAPLMLRPVATSERRRGGMVEETSEFAGYAFARGQVVVPAPSFVATPKAGGAVRNVAGNPLTLQVAAALADDALETPLELPGEPMLLPVDRRPWLAWGALLLAGGVALVRFYARRPRRAPRPVPTVVGDPTVEALARLRALRGSVAEAVPFAVQLAAVLRGFVRARFAVPALERTTGETVAALVEVAAKQPAGASQALELCDAVKFARAQPSPSHCGDALAQAERFVADNPREGAS